MMGDLFGGSDGSDEEAWDDCEQFDLPGATGLCGLVNQGNTCYMNSLLQTLYLTPEFRHGVYSLSPAELHLPTPECPEPEPDSQRQILIALQDLFARLQEDDIEATDTEELTSSFGAGFNVNQQEDLQELKVILMDSLASELDGTSARELLPSLFQGVYQNQIVVDPCDALPDGFTRNLADEVFTDVFVQVSGAHTLEVALRAKVTFDDLSGPNQWACDEAGGVKVDANKGVSFKRLPQLLCFTLMRFEMNWMVDPPTRSKITDRMTFPLELDMAPFTRGLRADGSEIASVSTDTCTDAVPLVGMLYDLSAVVVHEGGAYGGHYHVYVRDVASERGDSSQAGAETDSSGADAGSSSQMELDADDTWRDPASPARQGSWFNFNDATVTRVSVDKLRSTFGGSSCAYMLVYRKRELNPSSGGLPSFSQPIVLPPHLREPAEIRRVALARKRADYEDALHSVNVEVHLPSSLLSDHETGLLRVIMNEDPSAGENNFELRGSDAEMTEDEQLAAAIAISMGEAAAPSPACSTKSVSLTMDSRWSVQKVREEISDVFCSMGPSKFADDAILYEAVSSRADWSLEPMMFVHQHAYVCNAENGSGCQGLSSIGDFLDKSRGATAHVLAWVPPSRWPDPACVDPVATWVARGETAQPIKLSIAQLMDTTAENEGKEEMDVLTTPDDESSQKRIRPPSRVEKLEHGVLLTAPYLDVHTLLLKIQEKTGIEPHNQLLLCVRQGYQKRVVSGQSGVGTRENLAECDGRISTLVESGVLSDEAELTVEVKQEGWRPGGGILSLAERAKAERDRIDLIHVFCEDAMLAGSVFRNDIPMPKGAPHNFSCVLLSFLPAYLCQFQLLSFVVEMTGSTIEDLRQVVKSAITSEVGCACTRLDVQAPAQGTTCNLCSSHYRLRRCIVEYDYATVDSTVFSAVDADLLLNDADLYTGSSVRVEGGLPPAADELTFPVHFQEKVSQSGDMIRWRAPSRLDFKIFDTVGQVKERLVEFANDLDAHPWMCETDERGVALEQLPVDRQEVFRNSFVWYTADCQLRIGPAVTTTAISVEPGRTLKDDSETLSAAGLTENMALYLQRGTAPKAGEVSLKLYRQASDMLPQPGCPVTGVVPLRADRPLPVVPETFSESMTLAELKTALAESLPECHSHSEEDSVPTTAQLASCLRLRYVAGSGDKRRPLHPTTILKADAGARLSTLRELHKSEVCALAVSILPQPELLLPTDKVFCLWQLQPAQGNAGEPQYVTPQAEMVVRPEPAGSLLTLDQLIEAIHRHTNIPTNQIRIAKRQVTNLAEWGPWQSVGEPILSSRADVVTDVLDTPLPGAEVVKRRSEKVHKLPDCTVLGVADASKFPLLQEGGSLEQLLGAAEGGAHWHRRASSNGDGSESKGKNKAERSREPETLKIRRYGETD